MTFLYYDIYLFGGTLLHLDLYVYCIIAYTLIRNPPQDILQWQSGQLLWVSKYGSTNVFAVELLPTTTSIFSAPYPFADCNRIASYLERKSVETFARYTVQMNSWKHVVVVKAKCRYLSNTWLFKLKENTR